MIREARWPPFFFLPNKSSVFDLIDLTSYAAKGNVQHGAGFFHETSFDQGIKECC